MKQLAWIVATAAVVLAIPEIASSQTTSSPPSQEESKTREAPPGEGVICAYAIYAALAEVGSRCRVQQDVEMQTELNRSVSRLGDYILRNSKTTPEQLAALKRKQSMADAATSVVCRPDTLKFYETTRKQGVEALRKLVDKAVEHPGTPTWGTCL